MEELQEILSQAQRGNLEAYGTLIQRFQGMAIGYAYSLLGDYHLAEDAAQEAFLDAYPNLAKVYAPAAFPSWLRKIVFKHCDRLTRRKQVEVVELSSAYTVASGAKGLSEQVLDNELSSTIHSAIETLPEHERTVTYLFYLANHSQKEIAEFLDIRVSTVKNRLLSARKRMQVWLLENASLELTEEALPIQAIENRMDFAMNVIEIIQAAENGDMSKLSTLLEEHPALAKAKAERPGATALHFASWAGQQAAAELLLDYGADIDLEDDSFRSTPLGWAFENGQDEMFEFLLSKGAKIKLRQAVSTGRAEVVQKFLDEEPSLLNTKRENMLPIHEAALFGQDEMLALLLEKGATVDSLDDFGRTALDITLLHPLPIYGNAYLDISDGVHERMARVLIEHGAQMKLWHAAALGKLTEVRTMLEADPARVDEKHFNITPLYCAAQFGHAEIVALLLDAGADVQACKPNGLSPLHASTWTGSVAVAQLLLENGAPVNNKTNENVTPLHMTAWRRHLDLVTMLLARGADKMVADANGNTALSLAETTESVTGWYPADWGPVQPPDHGIVELLR